MADEVPPVGSVAEEAARLLDALGSWAATSGYAAGPRHTDAHHDDAAPEATADGEGSANRADTGDAKVGADANTAADAQGDGGAACPTCGADRSAGRAVTCQLCPVCQGIGLLRSLRPETVDRLADVAAAVAAGLRDLAEQRRGSGAEPAGPERGGSRTRPDHRPRVQDIEVHEEPGR